MEYNIPYAPSGETEPKSSSPSCAGTIEPCKVVLRFSLMLQAAISLLLATMMLVSGTGHAEALFTCHVSGKQQAACCCKPSAVKPEAKCGTRKCCKEHASSERASFQNDSSCGCCSVAVVDHSQPPSLGPGQTLQLELRTVTKVPVAICALAPAYDLASFLTQRIKQASSGSHTNASPPLFLRNLQIRC